MTRRAAQICSVDGCNRDVVARGWCSAHYQRWKKDRTRPPEGEIQAGKGDRLAWIKAHASFRSDSCLRWPFSYDPSGYGAAWWNRKKSSAHRVMCMIAHGAARGARRQAAHSCGNRWCVNPRHLRWATPSENCLDQIAHGTAPRGEKNGFAKLTEPEVLEIRRQRSRGISSSVLAWKFGISEPHVRKICCGSAWRHAS